MSSVNPKPAAEQPSSQATTTPHNEARSAIKHYIGIDVGTGSARACVMTENGDIVGLASKDIGLWQPQTGYYVSSSSVPARNI